MASGASSLTTNLTRPKTSATLTLRIIKSFEYRTQKNLVIHNINLEETSVGQLKGIACQVLLSQPDWKPYRNVVLDTLKLYSKAHGAKTSNLIINLNHDDWILEDDENLLINLGFENETEVSFFNRQDYEQFKVNPQTSWDC